MEQNSRWKMLQRPQVLEDGRIVQRRHTIGKLMDKKRRITRKEYQRLLNKFEMEGFMAH